MAVPKDLKFTKTHEWVKVDGDTVTIGLSDYAQGELGDITYVELPQAGENFSKADSFGVVESVKAASDVYTPVSGEVVESNEETEDAPEMINQSPFEKAWLVKIKLSDPSELDELMDSATYEKYLEEEGAH